MIFKNQILLIIDHQSLTEFIIALAWISEASPARSAGDEVNPTKIKNSDYRGPKRPREKGVSYSDSFATSVFFVP